MPFCGVCRWWAARGPIPCRTPATSRATAPALDFWSINDHAEATTPRRWQETREAIRQCNAVAGDPENPDVVAFLGWEWSQVGITPEEHYGHKNVILRDLDDAKVPSRVIGAAGLATDALRGQFGGMPWYVPLVDFPNRQRYFNFIEFMDEVRDVPACAEGVSAKDLPADCYESAATPKDLFRKLDEWGIDAIVIPHGNTWGFYTPPGSTWDKQLAHGNQDPRRQFLIEVMSGHGNSEEYRDWQEVLLDASGKATCPEPRPDYLPSCWRAGEIIDQRCRAAGIAEAECAQRAADARQHYVDGRVAGHWSVPGVQPAEWLDSGQCRDCFLPSFNYRPGGSTQYALAISNFDDPSGPQRFRFGLIASSDNHQARPGTGYKEFARRQGMTEARGARDEAWRKRINPWIHAEEAVPESREVPLNDLSRGFTTLEAERQASFFLTGGLAAVHTEGRSREQIWDAHSTQGSVRHERRPDPALVPPAERRERRRRARRRADGWRGAHDGYAALRGARGRRVRAEAGLSGVHDGRAVRRPHREAVPRASASTLRTSASRSPASRSCASGRRCTLASRVRELIEDPWKKIACEPSPNGCVVQFEDPDFATADRDTRLLRARHRGAEPGRERGRTALPQRRERALSRGEPVPGRLPHAARRRLPGDDRGTRLVIADLRRSRLRRLAERLGWELPWPPGSSRASSRRS